MKDKKETSDYLSVIAKTSTIVFLGVALSKLINYGYKIIIANYFGPETYGLFSLGLIVVAVFSAFASLGLIDGVLRYVSFYRGKKQGGKIKFIIKTAVFVTLLTSLVSAFLLFMLSEFIAETILKEPQLIYFLKILAVSIPLSVLSGIYLAVIRAYEKIGTFSFLINFLHNALKLGLLIIFIFLMSKTNALLFSYVLAFTGLLIAAYIIYRVKIKVKDEPVSGAEKSKIVKEALSFSWPLIFTSLLSVVFLWTDSFLLGYFMDATTVGLYNSAVTLVGLFSIAQELFMQLFLPLISKELAKNKTEVIKEISKQIFKWIFIINIPLFVALFVFPEFLINLFFTETYVVASESLRILAIGALLSCFVSLFNGLISAKGKTKTVLIAFLICALLNVALDIILIPIYQMGGAAIATTVSWILFSFIMLIQVKVNYGFYPLRRKVVRIVLISIIPTLVLYALKNYVVLTLPSVILLGILFCIIYLGLIIFTKSLDYNDLNVISSLKGKTLSLLRLNKPSQEVGKSNQPGDL